MLDYWWVTRPKRQLNSIPEILATFAEHSLAQEWKRQRGNHLQIEAALEQAGLKRKGERRDRTGGGGRTYLAWLKSLGLMFAQKNTKLLRLTLAGEAILKGGSPVPILRNQILKYQFPSSFSLGVKVEVSRRFKIRPFRFLFRLLSDPRVSTLSQEEIAKIVIVEAENESIQCYEHIVNRIIEFRSMGDKSLDKDFPKKYGTSIANLNDIANTIINWINYTQLIARHGKEIGILPEKFEEVAALLALDPHFIDRPEEEEVFQRKYGLDPDHKKDTRNLLETYSITPNMIAEQKVKSAFISKSIKRPIASIDNGLIEEISQATGIVPSAVEDILYKSYPAGAIGGFMTRYFEMAFAGKEDATEFELATAEIFKRVFKFNALHVGAKGKTPDVLIVSDEEGFQAIIDNKAYKEYSISNDHRNRMLHNYIKGLSEYGEDGLPLAFFSYIAGGFKDNFDSQLKSLCDESGVPGSGISVTNMIRMIQLHNTKPFAHNDLKSIFSVNRRVRAQDLESRANTEDLD